MQTPRIVHAATSADLAKLVPALAGADPRESLVLVAFRGRRTAGGLRVDLPAADSDTEALTSWAHRVVGMLLRVEGVDGVVPVAYTDAAFADEADGPRRALLYTVASVSARAGLAVKDVIVVGGDAWASLADPDADVDARPLAELVPDDLAHLDAVRPTGALTRVDEADPAAQDDFADRVEAWLVGDGTPSEVHGLPVDTGFRARARARGGLVDRALDGQDVVPFIEAAFAEHPDSGQPCECRALLVALLMAPVLRDVVLLQAGWGVRFAHHTALHTIPTDLAGPMDEAVLLAFTGGDFARPEVGRVERVAALLTALAGHLPLPDRGPVLTAAAWLHWALGHGSAAGALVDAALESDPEYGLAEILAVRLARGDLPEWAFRSTPGTPAGRRWREQGARART